jgi:hypothetical protein
MMVYNDVRLMCGMCGMIRRLTLVKERFQFVTTKLGPVCVFAFVCVCVLLLRVVDIYLVLLLFCV